MTTKTLLPAKWERRLAALGAFVMVALLSSCAQLDLLKPKPKPAPAPPVAEKKPPPEPIKPPPPSRLYEWRGSDDYVSRIEISINEQKARFYRGDKEVGWTTVASGVHRYPTPTGSFAVLEKVQNKKSNLYGRIYNKNGKLVKRNAKMGVDSIPNGGRFQGAPMPYFLRLTNDGIGMHAGPIPRPGNRASHGCIRMPKKFAPILYRYVDIGTPVTIKGNGPAYASYVAKRRRSAPKAAPTAVPGPESAVVSAETPASPAPGDSAEARAVTGTDTAAAASGPANLVTSAATASTASAPTSGAVDVASDLPANQVSRTADPTEALRAPSDPTADSGPAPTSSAGIVATAAPAVPPTTESAVTQSEAPSSTSGGSQPTPAGETVAPAPDEVHKPVPPSVEEARDTPLPREGTEATHPTQVEGALAPTEAEAAQRGEG
jgi:hypothetical protein